MVADSQQFAKQFGRRNIIIFFIRWIYAIKKIGSNTCLPLKLLVKPPAISACNYNFS